MFDWTDERCDELRRLQGMNFSASQIGQRLGGITKNAVIGKLGRLGIQGKRGPKPAPKPATVAKQRKARFQTPPTAPQPPVEPVMEIDDTPLDIEAIMARAVPLIDLENHHCRWPVSSDPYLACGDPSADVAGGVSYCSRHCRMAYAPSQPRRRYTYNPPRIHA